MNRCASLGMLAVSWNTSYKDLVKYGAKMAIVGTSIVKGLRMKEFTKNLENSFIKLWPLPVVLLKQSALYIVSTLVDNVLNHVVIYDRCNDISKPDRSYKDTVKDIEVFVKICLSYWDNYISNKLYDLWMIRNNELIFC